MIDNFFTRKFITNNDKQRFAYFPSLSSGNSRMWLLKNREFSPGVSSRFYDMDYPDKFRHPSFLISAGHCPISDMEFRGKLGLENAIVMGDSGGHQICTGAVPWDKFKLKRDQIFEWLESNADISMNLDIPPRVVYENRFQEALDTSYDNFKYFADKQTGRTDFVNILQTRSEAETKIWYDRVKGMPFCGWGIGSAGSVRKIMYTVALFLENGEFDKVNNRWFHYLGITSISYLFLLAMLQRQFNKRYNGRVVFSTDSSSPNRATIFGQYYYGVDWKRLAYTALTFNKNGVKYDESVKLPCTLDCPACKGRTFADIVKFDEYQYMVLTNHNMHIFQNIMESVNLVTDCPYEVQETFLPKEFVKLHQSIEEMVNSDEPMRVYEKYTHMYESISSKYNITSDNTVSEKFFDFE